MASTRLTFHWGARKRIQSMRALLKVGFPNPLKELSVSLRRRAAANQESVNPISFVRAS